MSAALLLLCLPVADPARPLEIQSEGDSVRVIARFPTEVPDAVPEGKLTQEQGEKWLRFVIVDGNKEGTAILGRYERVKRTLLFRPMFPVVGGLRYRARFRAGKRTVSVDYKAPKKIAKPEAVVEKVCPTSAVLPANTLKFYLHFSKPMRGGKEIFRQIVLLDDKGEPVYDPWQRDELWTRDDKRLTLYFQPGRIKWGVLLRMLFGPPMLPDRRYTLVVKTEMIDLNGASLRKEYRKTFRTIAEDRDRIELKQWKLAPPASGTRRLLQLTFPKPLDHMSIQRFLKVVDRRGKPVAGNVSVSQDAKSWSFRPDHFWKNASYSIEVDGRLEDVAGNTPLRPFDLDLEAPKLPRQQLTLQFRPK